MPLKSLPAKLLLAGGGSFQGWSIAGGLLVSGDMLLEGTVGPQTLSFLSTFLFSY